MGRLLFVTVTTVLSPRSQVRARQQFGGLDIVNELLRDGDSSAACVRDAEPDELGRMAFEEIKRCGQKE